ncbi:MAG: DUF4445 domain-containing protein [Spirochaetales bacterium]|nr:DUF4445 domain-containing protein [Spirochaetales bacterium]
MQQKSFRVTFEPDGKSAQVPEGTTVFETAKRAGVAIKSECGGMGVCGSCVVNIMQGAYEQSGSERFIGPEQIARGTVLACRTRVMGDMVVEIPPSSRVYEQQILTQATQGRRLELSPNIRKLFIKTPEPSLEDQSSDLDRLRRALQNVVDQPEIGVDALRTLPQAMREQEFAFTVAFSDEAVVAVEAGDTSERNYGVAFDIGTTTVVGYLLDLNTGEQLGVASRSNPQTSFGEDVVSRIQHAQFNEKGLEELNQRIVACLNDIIGELEREAGAPRRFIYEVTAAGNTTMNHLLLELDPRYIAVSPYVNVLRSSMDCRASELGIDINPCGRVYTLPNIAAFVGGDTVGVILASGIHQSEELRFAVDVGTNGELVMGSRERLLACSTAAGPAFEGARILHGMRASDGAIEKVQISGPEVVVNTIGNGKPVGICGSGLIDVVAELLEIGGISESGKLLGSEELSAGMPVELRDRFIVHEQHGPCFVLVRGEDSRTGEDILLTRRDVRELQLAKSAIRAGYAILKKELGVGDEDIVEILLAGAFGNYIRREQAKRVGLLPEVPTEKIRFIGNAAGEGARMVLLDKRLRREASEISTSVEYVELSARKDFQEVFMEAQFFPVVSTAPLET